MHGGNTERGVEEGFEKQACQIGAYAPGIDGRSRPFDGVGGVHLNRGREAGKPEGAPCPVYEATRSDLGYSTEGAGRGIGGGGKFHVSEIGLIVGEEQSGKERRILAQGLFIEVEMRMPMMDGVADLAKFAQIHTALCRISELIHHIRQRP